MVIHFVIFFLTSTVISFTDIFFDESQWKTVLEGEIFSTENSNAKNTFFHFNGLIFSECFFYTLIINLFYRLSGKFPTPDVFEEGFSISFIVLVVLQFFLNAFFFNLTEFMILSISSLFVKSFSFLKNVFLLQISTLYLAGKTCYLPSVFSQSFF